MNLHFPEHWLEPPRVRANPAGGIFDCTPDWSWTPAALPDHDLWLVCQGRGRLTCGSRSWTLGAGDCFLFPPGTSLHASHEPANPLRVVAQHFDFLDGRGQVAIPTPVPAPPFHRQLPDLPFMAGLLARAVKCREQGQAAAANFWVGAALAELARPAADQPPAAGPGGARSGHIAEICAQIRRWPGAAHGVAALARRLHVCPDHFAKLFREATGAPPRAFITNCRIAYARSLLLESNLPLRRIAELAGYGSLAHFSKQFKGCTGVAPSRLRTPQPRP
ncbi:MAG: AraC family transcriptional regulator [Lentisphaeria bacterium]|jgi:AraC-like DNA-binding protein